MGTYGSGHKSGRAKGGQLLPAVDTSPGSGSPAGLRSGPEKALMSGGRGHFLGRPSVRQLPVRSQGTRSLNSHGVVWETSQQ